MRETSPRGWHRWRVAVIKSTATPTFDRMTRQRAVPVAETARTPEREELRGTDGIRHELVARVRQQIADGSELKVRKPSGHSGH